MKYHLAFLFVLLAVIGSLVIAAPPASAHVLKEDNGIYGVLHIPPDDSPSAGQQTDLSMSFGDAQDAFLLQDCDCRVVIKKDGATVQRTGLKPSRPDSTLAGDAFVNFPSVGVYEVLVEGSAKDGAFADFKLDYTVRVAVAIGQPAAASKGADILIIGAGALAILAMVATMQIRQGRRYIPAAAKPTGNKRKGRT